MTAYGFMQPLYAPQPPKTWSAVTITCPNPACSAPAGTACGGRCCPEDVAEAVERARRGDLEETAPAAPATFRDDGLGGCTRCRTFNLRVVACEEHRCAATVQGRGACRTARTEGSRYCHVHRCTIEGDGVRCSRKACNKKCAHHAGR